MIYIFKHRIYRAIIIDTDKLALVKDSYYPAYLEKFKNAVDFRKITNFSHSNYMWTDDFRGYDHPDYVMLSKEVVDHEFNKLREKYGVSRDDIYLDNEECVYVNENFDSWLKKNLLYMNKRYILKEN